MRPPVVTVGRQLPVEGEMPSLARATGWINSQPLTATGLRGTVVLIDFWTYTCINWLRSLPYVRAWAEKYKDRGLVVIGVHTPEFAFEKDVDNVRRAARDMRVDYPIALDNDLTFRTLCRSAKACLGNPRKTGSGSQSMRILSPIVCHNIVP
jgi:thiol-disulfide isomerase/thioredoxin